MSRDVHESAADYNYMAAEASCMMYDDCTIEPDYNLSINEDRRARLAKLSQQVIKSDVCKKAQDLIKFKR